MGTVTLTFWHLLASFVPRTRTIRLRPCTLAPACSRPTSSVSSSCAALTAVTLPDSTRFRMRLRSSVETAIKLSFHQTHRFFNTDLFGGETIKYGPAIGTSLVLRRTTHSGHSLMQAAAIR